MRMGTRDSWSPSNATLVAQRIHSVVVDELLVSRPRLEIQTFDHGPEGQSFVVIVRGFERSVGRHPLRICDGIDGKDIAGGCGMEKEQNLGDQLRTDQLPFCSHDPPTLGTDNVIHRFPLLSCCPVHSIRSRD
jgi:hypothetical protein